ncbi:hypothetical protein [Kitasatospora sp. A2-31]|uniref:hypothetical protein n=1 Tax=Kitasatospora sp. A2-31 TaxID=2916414 RepID=UPI001EE9D0D4|nr:hypothetical protein [Kitasatospora sp. A2-31]MCG6497619.1 hypothetical protein [Kitasatospora sp. A2-31]
MSAGDGKSTPPVGVLPAVAALHVLFAARPELALLPGQWLIEADDIHFLARGLSPEARVSAEALASALGVEVRPGIAVERPDGHWLPLYVEGTLSGIRVFVSAHAPVEGPEAER